MSELREKIADAIGAGLMETRSSLELADRILAIPEIADPVRTMLLDAWHRLYGDGQGWSAFKAAVDEDRFDDAMRMLAPGLLPKD